KKEIINYVNEPIGELSVDLTANKSRLKDTPIIDLIHKIQLEKTNADISIAASFKTNVNIPAGPVSLKSAFLIYPFENTLYKLEIKGSDIITHLQNSAAYYMVQNDSLKNSGKLPGYNFDMAEGIQYKIVYKENKKTLIKADKLTNGKIFHPNKKYTVAVNSYRAQQLAKHYKCEILYKSNLTMRDFIVEYFKNN
ncbi:MAG: 5'-nucleotidase C-terminal domain-containing protein, partial [Calditrichia bacterium]|nr:5'-nucleotidase C-terminal domain-containing protein [Calditrichia bacterium]